MTGLFCSRNAAVDRNRVKVVKNVRSLKDPGKRHALWINISVLQARFLSLMISRIILCFVRSKAKVILISIKQDV